MNNAPLTINFLDTLDNYVTERDDLFTALSQANLLLTRFKLSGGLDNRDLHLLEFINTEDSDSDSDGLGLALTVRNRKKEMEKEFSNHRKNKRSVLTKADQLNELKVAFSDILHDRLIPLATLQHSLFNQ